MSFRSRSACRVNLGGIDADMYRVGCAARSGFTCCEVRPFRAASLRTLPLPKTSSALVGAGEPVGMLAPVTGATPRAAR